MKSFLKQYWALLIPVVILLAALLFLLKGNGKENTQPLGMIDAAYVDVAAEFPGRLDSLLVKQGDTVRKGQLLGVLRTTEINAVREQARAAIDAAQGQLKLLEKGARPEMVQSAGNIYKIAQDQYDLAKKTYERLDRLYRDSVVSGTERDLIHFKYQAAQKEMEIARLNQEMLQKAHSPSCCKLPPPYSGRPNRATNSPKRCLKIPGFTHRQTVLSLLSSFMKEKLCLSVTR
ncbi:biotin/lipoyl-binding protein [Chitinophaga sedimenti]|uniref:HlyD family secretion protein n=1 Tax=Chitinophaga sedimenti TaxID=2033606 RepID=UPI0020059C55|nr:biotin/lipoyl-binding protein [Chitinophaga sedimenti]MCK7554459.1 biotin/lipoyl-binding protein [Chitinophaga sedimenti]